MSEATEQAALIQWADLMTRDEPRLALLFHVPNGGKRSKGAAGQMKAQGVRAGVPDLWLPVRGGLGASGLVIEMKAARGTVSAEQQRWIERLRYEGYHVRVCYAWTEAARVICWYLDRGDLPLPEEAR